MPAARDRCCPGGGRPPELTTVLHLAFPVWGASVWKEWLMARKATQPWPAAKPEPLSAPEAATAAAGPDLEPLLRELSQRMLDALNRNTAAILAAGIMSSRGRPHTPDEAVRLHQEMINTMWPKT